MIILLRGGVRIKVMHLKHLAQCLAFSIQQLLRKRVLLLLQAPPTLTQHICQVSALMAPGSWIPLTSSRSTIPTIPPAYWTKTSCD